jgi:hypothetical protein
VTRDSSNQNLERLSVLLRLLDPTLIEPWPPLSPLVLPVLSNLRLDKPPVLHVPVVVINLFLALLAV